MYTYVGNNSVSRLDPLGLRYNDRYTESEINRLEEEFDAANTALFNINKTKMNDKTCLQGNFRVTMTERDDWRSDVKIEFENTQDIKCKHLDFIQVVHEKFEQWLHQYDVTELDADKFKLYYKYTKFPGKGAILNKKGDRPIEMTDVPGVNKEVKFFEQEFETCAVCVDGDEEGTIYGCLKWGHQFSKAGGRIAWGDTAGAFKQGKAPGSIFANGISNQKDYLKNLMSTNKNRIKHLREYPAE